MHGSLGRHTPASTVSDPAPSSRCCCDGWRSVLSAFNERQLRARGAIEPRRRCLSDDAMGVSRRVCRDGDRGRARRTRARDHPAGGLVLFGLAKALKAWAIATLGPRWTFRVLVLPGAPLVQSGPYRFIAHPNYLAVVGELVGVAVIVWAPITGVAGDDRLRPVDAARSASKIARWPRLAVAARRVSPKAAARTPYNSPREVAEVGDGARRAGRRDGPRRDLGRRRRRFPARRCSACRLSVTDWWRPALWSAVALVVRHAIVRRHPLPQRVGARRSSLVAAIPTRRVVLPIHLATRGGVLAVGFLAVILIGYPPEATSPLEHLLERVPRSAGAMGHRLVSRHRHRGLSVQPRRAHGLSAEHRVLPGVSDVDAVPLGGARAPAAVDRRGHFAGRVLSRRSATSCAWRATELGDEDAAVTAVTLLAAYPFAVFYSAAYTEALFLLTLVGAVYHFRRDQLWRAGVLGICVRPDAAQRLLPVDRARPDGDRAVVGRGALAADPAAADRLAAPRRRASPPRRRPGFGMLMFSAFIYQLTGNPFNGRRRTRRGAAYIAASTSLVADRVGFIATNGLYAYASTQTIDFFYLLAVLFALGAVWPVYRRFGLPYAVHAAGQRAAAAGRRRPAVDGTSDVGVVPGVPVDGRRRAGASPRRRGSRVRVPAGICRRDVLHLAAVVLRPSV